MIEIRHLEAIEDVREAVRLQKEIWGFADVDLLPLRLFVVATKVGGQVIGAFDGARMVGFLVAIPGIKPDGENFLHSNMMGVNAEYRDAGVGRTLKLAQRNEALSRGIRLVEWTFDPLEIKNAFFNIERLGAVVGRYVLNQYGVTTSQLHGGLPTDRCIAEWFLDSPRVAGLLAGTPEPRAEVKHRIAVPNDIATIRQKQPDHARKLQAKVSDDFLSFLQQGYHVAHFDRGDTQGTYEFTK